MKINKTLCDHHRIELKIAKSNSNYSSKDYCLDDVLYFLIFKGPKLSRLPIRSRVETERGLFGLRPI